MKNHFLWECRMASLEKITACISILLGGGMVFYLSTTSWEKKATSIINNPAFYPRIVAYGFILIGIGLLLMSVKTPKEARTTVNSLGFVVVALWALFAALCAHLGFVLSAAVIIFVTFWLWGARNRRSIILVSILAPAIIYLCLGILMGVNFPTLIL